MEGQASPPVHVLSGPFALSETSDEVMSRTDSNVTDPHGPPAAAWGVSVPYCRPVRLAWKDLTVSVNGGQFVVLDGVTGHAEPGRLLAIMGPSGCGKTTLLETLAGGRLKNAVQSGQVLVNGREDKLTFGKTAAYVTQDDTLIGTLSVYETIWYSACLRFPDAMPHIEKQEKVDLAILEMGLYDARQTRVGSWGVKGLSGGEKRRLSIAMEILTRPNVIFLDEPTSGLDSAAAYFVIQRLKDLAKDGHTIISVVHQPSSEVFQLFQDLLLLSGGRTVYFGKLANSPEFFANAGYPCPPLRNPSDHYLRCINKDFDNVRRNGISIRKLRKQKWKITEYDEEALKGPTDPLEQKEIKDVVEKLINGYQKSEQALATAKFIDKQTELDLMGEEMSKGKGSQSSFLMQLYILTRRSFVNMRRDWSYYWVRLIMYIALAIFIGWVYHNEGLDYQSINGRGACLSFVVGFLTFMSIGGFPSFVEDMKVFTRERQNGHYGVLPFIIANTLSSLPFLLLISISSSVISYFIAGLHPGFDHYMFYCMIVFSALVVVESLMMAVAGVVPNFLMGIVVGASIMGVLLLVSGFFRLPDEIPTPVTKVPLFYINFFSYALQGMYKNEFTGLTFRGLNVGDPPISGEYVLRVTYQMTVGRSKWIDLAILSSNIFAYRALFFLLIKAKEMCRLPWPCMRYRLRIIAR
ncbi:unnamed protein product [Calypogeia fissa]